MRKFTYEQYRKMAERFNEKPFIEKIRLIKENSDILTLASDYNWWGVKVKDEEIQERLFEEEAQFNIEHEWGHNEMYALVELLGIGNTDI